MYPHLPMVGVAGEAGMVQYLACCGDLHMDLCWYVMSHTPCGFKCSAWRCSCAGRSIVPFASFAIFVLSTTAA